MKPIKIIIFILFVVQNIKAQPAEGAYFSNTELQLHPRKIIAPNGQIAYMWSDCYEQLNFMQRADLKQYYDSALAATNQRIDVAQKNCLLNPEKKIDLGQWEADKSFYTRKLKYINDFDEWEKR